MKTPSDCYAAETGKIGKCSLSMKAKKTKKFISGNILLTEFLINNDSAQRGVH